MTSRPARLPAHLLPGDLLFGGRAIAVHLGVKTSTVARLVRADAIPWFALDGVACARRSTLSAHFAALEKAASSGERHLPPPRPSQR